MVSASNCSPAGGHASGRERGAVVHVARTKAPEESNAQVVPAGLAARLGGPATTCAPSDLRLHAMDSRNGSEQSSDDPRQILAAVPRLSIRRQRCPSLER